MPAHFEDGLLGGTIAGQRWAAWHGLGTMIPEHVFTAADAMQLVPALATEVVARPLYWQDHLGQFHKVDGEVANVREMDQKWLANVSDAYERVQPWKAFEFMDDLVGSGEAKYHTAIVLDGGRRICLTVSLNDLDIKVAGMDEEKHEVFIVLSNSYDRSSGLRACTSIIRTVCANTEAMSFNAAPRIWSMRHTESINGKLADAKNTLGLVHTYVAEFERTANELVQSPMAKSQYAKFLEELIPVTPKIEKSERMQSNRTETLDSIRLIHDTAPNLDGVRDTKWAAYNSVTEYSDWFTRANDTKRASGEERRWMRQLDQSPLKDRALELLAR